MGLIVEVPLVDEGPYYEVRKDGTVVVTPRGAVPRG